MKNETTYKKLKENVGAGEYACMWRELSSWPGELVGPGERGQDNPPAPKEGGLGGGRASGAEIVENRRKT